MSTVSLDRNKEKVKEFLSTVTFFFMQHLENVFIFNRKLHFQDDVIITGFIGNATAVVS